MTKVLIFGATGYLGRRIADALVRSGQHTVYGIARSEAKAASLALHEVLPVLSAEPVRESAIYLNTINSQNIDIVIDASGLKMDSSLIFDNVKNAGDARLQAWKAKGFKTTTPKLGYIYCSGAWVHGDSDKLVNDLELVGNGASVPPPALVAWRTELERSILEARDVLDVVILRPSLTYGRESTIWTSFFLPVLQAARSESTSTIELPLRADARLALVHVDDVAVAFKCAVEKLSSLNSSVYPVFDISTSQESMSEIFAALVRVWQPKGEYSLNGPSGDLFAQAMSTTLNISSERARSLLGWSPTRIGGFVNNMHIYAPAFASQH